MTCVSVLNVICVSILIDFFLSFFVGVSIQESGELYSPKELKICTGQIQELVIGALNNAIAGKLLGSLDIFRDSCTG